MVYLELHEKAVVHVPHWTSMFSTKVRIIYSFYVSADASYLPSYKAYAKRCQKYKSEVNKCVTDSQKVFEDMMDMDVIMVNVFMSADTT